MLTQSQDSSAKHFSDEKDSSLPRFSFCTRALVILYLRDADIYNIAGRDGIFPDAPNVVLGFFLGFEITQFVTFFAPAAILVGY